MLFQNAIISEPTFSALVKRVLIDVRFILVVVIIFKHKHALHKLNIDFEANLQRAGQACVD